MSIILTPATEQRLATLAALRGTSPDTLASQLLDQVLAEEGNTQRADAPADRLSSAELADSVESVRLGFADVDAGRTSDATQVFASVRRKVGL